MPTAADCSTNAVDSDNENDVDTAIQGETKSSLNASATSYGNDLSIPPSSSQLDSTNEPELFECLHRSNKAQKLVKLCSETSMKRSVRSSIYPTDDYTPFIPEDPMEYTIDHGKDDTLCSYECPQHYKEMMLIVAELRKQRHLALESFQFTPPNISKDQLNYPYAKRSKINNGMQSNFNNNTIISTCDYDDI